MCSSATVTMCASSTKGEEALISRRIATRHEHFMPQSLLHSQFQALEEPGTDERPLTITIEPGPREIVARIVSSLKLPEGLLWGARAVSKRYPLIAM
jgi:hypothetical protein